MMACRYAFNVGSDYKVQESTQILFSRSFITSSVQPSLFCSFCSLGARTWHAGRGIDRERVEKAFHSSCMTFKRRLYLAVRQKHLDCGFLPVKHVVSNLLSPVAGLGNRQSVSVLERFSFYESEVVMLGLSNFSEQVGCKHKVVQPFVLCVHHFVFAAFPFLVSVADE